MFFIWLAVVGSATAAQAQGSDAPGPYVVDLRAGLGALPRDAGLFPDVPSGTRVASAGLAFDVGGHVYLIRLGPARVGIGASFARVGGKMSQQPAQSGAGSQTTLPEVQTRFTTIAPQLSLNFGTADGWSYISAGIGQAKARVTTSAFVTGSGDTAVTTEGAALSTSLRALNVGGGARWFIRRHLAISFDVRFHIVSDTGGETPIPRTTLAVVTGGISLR
jgi:outer membrane protein with beta-barrel domain